MDYKERATWVKTFPNLPYPGMDNQVYQVFNYPLSPANLGNMNAAAYAKSLGIPTELARWQFGAAHLRDHPPEYDMLTSQLEALKRNYYGDSPDCYKYTKIGFELP